MDIRSYLAESERIYNYRIKTVVPIKDDEMSRIERAVIKYQPLNILRPKKTMLQSHPLDFPGVMNAEVFIIDLELALPASAYVLQQELRVALDLPEQYIVVRGDNEPGEIETERLVAARDMSEEAAKAGMTRAALLTIPDYAEAEPVKGEELYGNAHTGRLLAYLQQVAKDRDESRVDPPNPLFRWLDLPNPDSQEPGQPKDNLDATRSWEPGLPGGTSIQGNLDDDGKYYRRAYKDANGNIKVLSRKPDFARKEK